MYQIIDTRTGDILKDVASPPTSLKEGQFLQEKLANSSDSRSVECH